MTWRNELRGIRRVDLVSAVLIVPTLAWAGIVLAQDAQETQVPQETQVQDAGETYAETWEWCKGRFPYRTDLQDACRWGAYEMLPGQEVPADERTQDA
jgi:hypothetical protein